VRAHELRHGFPGRLHDEEPASRAAAGGRELVPLDESDGLVEHRTAHPIALGQLRLGSEPVARPQSAIEDLVLDPFCDA
jgi:hypothetical protein